MWSKDFYERLTSDDLAKGVTEAERLLASHKERKVCVLNLYVAHWKADQCVTVCMHSSLRESWRVDRRTSTESQRKEMCV